MKYSRTLDKVLAALAFQVEGNHAQAARFFASAASAQDVTSVIASLEKQSQAAFASVQTAKEKPSLAKLLATAKKPKKVVKAETEDMLSDDDMDDVLDDMTASEEDEEISLEDLDDAASDETDEEGVEEMPEATVAEDCDPEEDAKMAKVTANLAALDRLKKTVKAKSK